MLTADHQDLMALHSQSKLILNINRFQLVTPMMDAKQEPLLLPTLIQELFLIFQQVALLMMSMEDHQDLMDHHSQL